MPKILPVLLVVVLSFFAVKSLFVPGYFSMHDDQQVVRLQQLDKSLMAGQFPVRWVSDLGFGYGYPLFNFYPPLAYYTGEIIHLTTGLGFIDSIKGVWLLAILGSGVAMYFLAKEFFGKWGGVVSAIFYVYAPYHALDAFVRGALAELSSFVWLPLILLFSYKNNSVITGIFLGLLMVTHNLIFLPFAGIFVLWSLFLKKNFITPLLIAFLLTAFFWLPSLYEKRFTLVDQLLIKNLASYQIHFLCPGQLWYSQWGFGGSTKGCIDGMSFMLGKIYFVGVGLGLIVSIWKKFKIGIFSFGLFLFSLFMTLPVSKIIWDNFSMLWYLQFPWRFLEFAVLFSSLLIGSLALLPKKLPVAAIFIVIVIFVEQKYFVPQKFLTNVNDKTMLTESFIKWDISLSSFEYLPSGFATKIGPLGTVVTNIDESKIGKYFFTPGRFEMDSYGPTTIQIDQTNFPGWKVWIDGKEEKIYDDNPYKLITINVPEGQHKVSGEFTNTRVRSIGNFISLGSIIGVAGLLFYGTRRNKVKSH